MKNLKTLEAASEAVDDLEQKLIEARAREVELLLAPFIRAFGEEGFAATAVDPTRQSKNGIDVCVRLASRYKGTTAETKYHFRFNVRNLREYRKETTNWQWGADPVIMRNWSKPPVANHDQAEELVKSVKKFSDRFQHAHRLLVDGMEGVGIDPKKMEFTSTHKKLRNYDDLGPIESIVSERNDLVLAGLLCGMPGEKQRFIGISPDGEKVEILNIADYGHYNRESSFEAFKASIVSSIGEAEATAIALEDNITRKREEAEKKAESRKALLL